MIYCISFLISILVLKLWDKKIPIACVKIFNNGNDKMKCVNDLTSRKNY